MLLHFPTGSRGCPRSRNQNPLDPHSPFFAGGYGLEIGAQGRVYRFMAVLAWHWNPDHGIDLKLPHDLL